jgi:hypothetical protein
MSAPAISTGEPRSGLLPRDWERLAARVAAAMLAIATLLACVMAVMGPINQRPDLWRGPPDEYGHRSAARYYVDHWLPPKVGDPGTLDSYSRDYGFSYLNDTDPSYFLAGKFAALISPLVPNVDLGFRLFNVLLLGLLAAFCALRPGAWLLFAPLALSPQLWYIFSYFNGDGWPLFLAVLIAYQLAVPSSLFNRYLNAPRVWHGFGGALVLGGLLALLVLSKPNYLVFAALVPPMIALARLGIPVAALLGLGAVAGAAWMQRWVVVDARTMAIAGGLGALAFGIAALAPRATRRARLLVLGKLAAMATVAAAVAVPRYYVDALVNESLAKKRAALIQLQEELAKPQYKPSVVYPKKQEAYYGMNLRARGTPLEELFAPHWAWHSKTFATATGSYGWIEFTASTRYYAAMLAGYLALLAVYAWGVLRSRDPATLASFGLVAAFSALTVGVALFHSWNNDFQAQGRYLFPIVAILGAGLHMARAWISTKAMLAVAAFCFALSVYSFVFIGLTHVPKSF